YYLAPSRVWELLTGAMLALGYVKQIENRHANEVIGITGVLMVGYAVFGFDHTTHFPGYAALIPCVGTAMVIYSGESHDTLVSKLLTSRPLIFTGLISYSLYLWHWPILVFANLYQDKPIEPWQIVILLGLAYLFAWISWRFVEKPFRGKQSKYTRKQMFTGAFTVMAGVSAFGLTLHLTEGLPVRMPDHVNQIVDLMES
ncbi:MAG: acyltransferase, partial [Candidatus Thiodiazotropha sp.]